jgi:PAS domain S-box-containing protein
MGAVLVLWAVCNATVPVWASPGPAEGRSVTAAVLRDFPPLYSLDEAGRPWGFAIDILDHVRKEAGFDVRYMVVDNWAEAAAAVRNGKADLVPGFGITPSTAKEFLFSEIMETVPVSCFVRQSNQSIEGIGDLRGRRTAVMDGGGAHIILASREGSRPIPFASMDSALFALLAGDVDAFVFPQPVLLWKARQLDMEDRIKVAGDPLMELKRGYLLRKGNEDLVTRINPAIRAFVASDAYGEAFNKWYGKPRPFWTPAKVLAAMGGLSGLLLVGMFVWRYFALAGHRHDLIHEVAERENAEHDLREYQANLEKIINERTAEVHAREAALREAQAIAHLGSWGLHLDSNRLEWSDETCRIFGVAEGSVSSFEAFLERVHPEDRDTVDAAWRAALEGAPYDIEHRILVDGQTRWVRERAQLTFGPDGSPTKGIGTVQDISDRKEAERILREKNTALERSNTDLESFAYVASHDLREPLRNVIAYSTLLERQLAGRLGDDERDFLKFVHDGAMRMDALVRDLLEFSRVGRTGKPTVAVSLDNVVANACRSLAVSIKEADGKIDIPPDLPRVMARPDDLERVLVNILGNALKYRRPEAPPRIEIGCARDGAMWRLSIRDNGIGIQPGHGYEDRVFRLFQRLHQKHEYNGGTGIGLAVCKKIIEYHGGRIWVESAGVGQGSTFHLTLPRA